MDQHEGVEVLSWQTLKELTPLLPRNDLDQPPSRRKIKNAFLLALFYVVFLAGCVFLVMKTVGFSQTLTTAVNTYSATAPPEEPLSPTNPLEIVDVGIEKINDSSSSSSSKVSEEEPSASPTEEPTESPTEEPTEFPTEIPTIQPTQIPSSSQPSYKPTTLEPTYEPSFEPTEEPTEMPIEVVSSKVVDHKSNDDYWSSHTAIPSKFPSRFPSVHPSKYPTESPTKISSRGSDDYWANIAASETNTNDDYWTKNSPTLHPSRIPTKGAMDVFHDYSTPSKYPSHVPTWIGTGEAEHHDSTEEVNLVIPTYVIKEEEETAAPAWNGPVVVHVTPVVEPTQPVVVEEPTIININGPFSWVSEWDTKTGKTYYWNTVTGQSQWEQPEWLTEVDSKTGKTYYVKTTTGESQWEQPTIEPEEETIVQPVETSVAPEPTVSVAEPVAATTTATDLSTTTTTTTATTTTTLPLNWISKTDTATGHIYYVNKVTGISQWEPPTEEVATTPIESQTTVAEVTISEPTSVPSEWLTKLDTKTGKTYYVNTATGISQWEQPAELVLETTTGVPTESESIASVAVTTSVPTSAPTAAQAEWLFKIDSKTGKAYYVNTATGVSQWEQPTESVPTASAAQPEATTTTASDSSTATTTTTSTESVEVAPIAEPEQSEWLTKLDTKTGKTYYVNTATGISQWEQPAELVLETTTGVPTESESIASVAVTTSVPTSAPTAAQAEWLFKIDSKTGKAYYVNTATGVSQWEQPSFLSNVMGSNAATTVSASDSSSATGVSTDKTAEAEASTSDGLPANWHSAVDEKSGRTYYYNTATAVSQWTKPEMPLELPSWWLTKTDPASGKVYYVNTVTGLSQWEFPITHQPSSSPVYPPTVQPTMRTMDPTLQPTSRPSHTHEPTPAPSRISMNDIIAISMRDTGRPSLQKTFRPTAISFDLQQAHPTFSPSKKKDFVLAAGTEIPWEQPIDNMVMPEPDTSSADEWMTDDAMKSMVKEEEEEVEAPIPWAPTPKPTWMPMSKYPSAEPSVKPSTSTPSVQPTIYTGPTMRPSLHPTMRPTHVPTTALPSYSPSANPSREPSGVPSRFPTTAAFAKAINKATKPTKEPTSPLAGTTQEDVGEDMYNYLLSFLSRKLEQVLPGSRKLLLRRGANNDR